MPTDHGVGSRYTQTIVLVSFVQINAFVMCGKLKSAYLIAVKGDRVEAIQEIAEVAVNTGQTKMVEICTKFLNQYDKKREAQERKMAQRKQVSEPNR